MASNAAKTEHSGAKHGNGAYWGRKVDAKAQSNKLRRTNDRKAVHSATQCAMHVLSVGCTLYAGSR